MVGAHLIEAAHQLRLARLQHIGLRHRQEDVRAVLLGRARIGERGLDRGGRDAGHDLDPVAGRIFRQPDEPAPLGRREGPALAVVAGDAHAGRAAPDEEGEELAKASSMISPRASKGVAMAGT